MTTLDLVRTPEREILDLSRLDLPGARVLGRYRYRTPHTPLPAHRHRGMIEICYLHRGNQHYELEGRRYDLRGGDVLVTMPGEWHSTGPDPENRGVLYWLILQPQADGRRFLGLPPRDASTLVRALRQLPSRHFRAPRVCHAVLESMIATAGDGGPLDVIARRCTLVGWLLELVGASRSRAIRGSEEWLEPVLRLMREQVDCNRQVPDFAEVAGLSVSHFKARFREAVGTAPAEYFLAMRIEEAKRRLRATTQPITRIAMDLGFGSSQAFATAFRRLAGCPPTAYRRAAD